MSNHQEGTIQLRQSPGADPNSSNKRNSGLFSFLKWFRSSSKESVNSQNSLTPSGSSESLNSTGTAASFSFVAPAAYKSSNQHKSINPGPETDTYKARLKQRDKIRERDLAKNVTLRKKYNLFFSRDTYSKKRKETVESSAEVEDNSKSLPLMTKKMDEKGHRRTNSDSSKNKKSGAYLHVKGKRKAPQPPVAIKEGNSTLSLRRKKRLAPPPPVVVTTDKVVNALKDTPRNYEDTIEYADVDAVLTNDSLKLDNGVLKPAKDVDVPLKAIRSAEVTPVSPKPWYKRNSSKKTTDNKYEPVNPVDFQRASNSNQNVKKEDNRKSNIMFLTNISELDREASEIIRQDKLRHGLKDIPEFMKPKAEQEPVIINKRKSAKDLIAKFNAITNVTKVTVNSALFGGGPAKEKKDLFAQKRHLEKINNNDSSNNNNNNNIDKFVPLAKCETSACIMKPATPKMERMERNNWTCPKCNLENDYWRIICHVCSTIKPYFDDLTSSTSAFLKTKNTAIERGGGDQRTENNNEIKTPTGTSFAAASSSKNTECKAPANGLKRFPQQLERSRTQINFTRSAFDEEHKVAPKRDDEREKLKKMLIEMKNSLPKRKSGNGNNAPNRKSTIQEDGEVAAAEEEKVDLNINPTKDPKLQEIEVKIAAKEKEVEQMKPASPKMDEDQSKNFLLMRPKDFEDIYSEKTGGTKKVQNYYANQQECEDLFLNVPKKLNDLKESFKDTLEINRLLKRLETAIAKGNLKDAAIFARELAQLKVNCSVIRQKSVGDEAHAHQNGFTVDMYVEDRISHRGPFPVQVQAKQTVFQLKQQIEKEFDIPVNVQRWILGKELATDDNSTLESLQVTTNGCPIYLYLVVPPKETNALKAKNTVFEQPGCSKIVKTAITKPLLMTKLEVENQKPKIVGEQLKVHVMIKPSRAVITESKSQVSEASASNASNQAARKIPPKAEPEDFTEYDKTLKTTWECEACTLINPNSSNMCLVCSTIRPKNSAPEIIVRQKKNNKKHYYELMNLDQSDLVCNSDAFECLICMAEIAPKEGVTLRECLHQFCKACLANTIEFCEDAEVKCPYRDDQYSCDIALQDREIKALVTKTVYEQFLAKSVAQAENKIDKSFHCKTPDCTGWCIFEDNTNEFHCPVCLKTNCITCQAIHLGLNCKEYQERMNSESETDEDAKRTREWLGEMVEKGEALTCPACQVILMKKWGCDWVRCTMCKTEICWVTRGLRWGPLGKGDLSGGCRCGVNGIKCHAKCNYCH